MQESVATQNPTRLAILGGEPTVRFDPPHFVWPPVSEATHEAITAQARQSLSIYNRSGIIAELEDDLARYHGRKHALLTSSGTAALHSLFVGAHLQPGDEVICPTYTFHATVTPLFFTGAIPVLAEAGAHGNLDPADVERRITPRTRAIMVTHLWGVPCEMDALQDIARRHGLMLFEDGSHAHGARYGGRVVGSFGDAAAFSLQGAKTVSGGEGGVLLTDDDDLYYRALLFGHYNKRCQQEIPEGHPLRAFAVTGMGLKLRIHPLAAAIARQQLDRLESVLAGRRHFAARMRQALGVLPGLSVEPLAEGVEPSWYGLIVNYEPEALGGLPLARFVEALQAEGCRDVDLPGSTRSLADFPLFQRPEALFPAYAGKVRYRPEDFPAATERHARSIKLPVWDRREDEPLVEAYMAAFHKVVTHHRELL